MKFQVKFYDIIDHNKCPSGKKSAEKCIFRKSFFHHSEPTYTPKVTLCSFNVPSIGFRFVLTSVAHLDTTTEKIRTSGRRLIITTITITHSFIHLRVKKMMIQNLINLKCGREEPGNYQLLRIL